MADPITNSVVGIAGKVLGKFVADKNLKMQLEHELKTQLQTANLAQIEVNMIQFAGGIAGIQVALPEFDFTQLSTILMAMLGMAGLRSVEKIQKVTKGN